MDVNWKIHGVSTYIQKCKRISTNKFESEFEFTHFSFKQYFGNHHKLLRRKEKILVSATGSIPLGFYTLTKPSTPLDGTAIYTANTSSCLLLLSNK